MQRRHEPEQAAPVAVPEHMAANLDGVADANGHVRVWYLWDGEREWRVDSLTKEQRRLPVHPGIWNDTLLVKRIVEGWEPSGDTV